MSRLLLIVAAGSGTRLGRDEPKALVRLSGRALLSWALDAFTSLSFSQTVVTAPPDHVGDFTRLVGDRARVIPGGETRSGSVRRGFEALETVDEDTVCIHDAARPLVTAQEAASVIRVAEETGAAIAATPVVDTIKRVSAGRVVETVDRSGLYAAATPQAFRAAILRRALEAGREATDEAALCETLGIKVGVVEVSRLSFKITTPEDLRIAEAILGARRGS
jgi:2-C-methyl-D-erythritol 4-phosphate cytidylyltransferase